VTTQVKGYGPEEVKSLVLQVRNWGCEQQQRPGKIYRYEMMKGPTATRICGASGTGEEDSSTVPQKDKVGFPIVTVWTEYVCWTAGKRRNKKSMKTNKQKE
jgi:hypothetical protein